MTLSGPNPAITGEAIRKALDPAETEAARQRAGMIERAALDEVELRELERAEFYADASSGSSIASATVEAPPRRTLLDRLLRR